MNGVMVAGGASVALAVRLCIRMSAWSWEICLPTWATILTVLCYVTFGLVCVLPMFNTFWQTWKMKSVGGGTRGEPLVASLLSYGCYLLLGLMNSGWKFDESVWVSGIGAFCYAFYIMLFLITIEHADQRVTLTISVMAAVGYFTFVVAIGLLTESIFALKWLCMIGGVASALAPLLLTFTVVDKYVENLPDWFSSASGLLYYIIWMVRVCVPPLDFFDAVANFSGATCSLIFLSLLYIWRNRHEPAAGQPEGIAAPLLAEPAAGQPEGIAAPLLAEQNAAQADDGALNVNEDPPVVDPPVVHPPLVDPPVIHPPLVDPPLVHQEVPVDLPPVHQENPVDPQDPGNPQEHIN